MYRIEWKKERVNIFIVLALFIGTALCYPYIPDKVMLHFNLFGQVDSWTDKNYFSACFPCILTAVIYLLMLFVPYLDPKKNNYEKFSKSMTCMRTIFVLFFSALSIILTAKNLGLPIPIEKAIPVSVGILFVFLGNILGKVKQNYFIGIKFPWTLDNEDVWNKTHRFGGWCFVTFGIILSVTALINPNINLYISVSSGVFLGSTLIIYSLVQHKKCKIVNKPH